MSKRSRRCARRDAVHAGPRLLRPARRPDCHQPLLRAASSGLRGSSLASQPTSLDTEGQIEQLQAAVRADPSDAGSYALLGDAYYQRARETGDPGYLHARRRAPSRRRLRRDPANVTAIAGQATLALARHDFSGGLRLGRRARALAPQMALPYAPLADAQIELGRYGARPAR